MIFKGTISVVGDTGDPLPIRCEVTDHRLRVTTRNGTDIGDWGIQEIAVKRAGNGFTIRAEGEELSLRVERPEPFADALQLGGTPRVSERVAAARRLPDRGGRPRWRAMAAAVGTVALIGTVTVAIAAILGLGPFGRDSATGPSPTTGAVATSAAVVPTTSPPTATTIEKISRAEYLSLSKERLAGTAWDQVSEAAIDGLLLSGAEVLCTQLGMGNTPSFIAPLLYSPLIAQGVESVTAYQATHVIMILGVYYGCPETVTDGSTYIAQVVGALPPMPPW